MVGGKVREDIFIDLCNVAKTLSDYSLEGQEGLNEIVAIDEDEEEEEGSEEEVVQDEEVEIEEEEERQIKKQSMKE